MIRQKDRQDPTYEKAALLYSYAWVTKFVLHFCLAYDLLELKTQDKTKGDGIKSQPLFLLRRGQRRKDMANLTEVLEVLSTRGESIKTDDLAKELRASVEGTRKQLTRLKQREFVEGDSKEGWYITDTGKAELEKGRVHPTMLDEGVTPRDKFEAIGRRIGISPDRITLASDIVWSQNYEDIKWVWEALLQADVRVDLARPWVNSWRAHLQKGIPPELERELVGVSKEEKEGKAEVAGVRKPVEGRSYILQDDMPVYVGKDLGDLFYQDAVDLARIRAARGVREAPGTQPQPMGPDDIIKLVNAVREWTGQGGQKEQKSYIVREGEEGAIVQEVESGKPVVLSSPKASKPVTYLVNPEGVVKEMQPGEPIVIKQQAAPSSGKTFIVRQTSEGIVAEEHDLGKPIIINNPALGSGMPAMMPFPVMDGDGKPVVGQDGQPVYANLEPMLKWLSFQGEQRRSDERHTALMGLVDTVKENLPDGIQALREAAAEARGRSTGKTAQQQVYECGECHAKFSLTREPAEGETVACPQCGHSWSPEEVASA